MRALGRQVRGCAARARRELRCAPVRPGSIEAPAPSAALCEATASAARSTPSLGVKTATFPSNTNRLVVAKARFPRPVWPHALAAGGTSAHLAASRGCGPTQSGRLVRAPSRAARSVSWLGIPAQRLPARNAPSLIPDDTHFHAIRAARAPARPERVGQTESWRDRRDRSGGRGTTRDWRGWWN
jgi:hypothetical protein